MQFNLISFSSNSRKLLGLSLIAFGLIAGATGGLVLSRNLGFIRSAARASALVVENVQVGDSEGGEMFRARYLFRDAEGREHLALSSVASYPAAHRIGDRIAILYSVRDPSDSRPDSWFLNYGIGAIVAAVGVSGLLGGGLLWRRHRGEKIVWQVSGLLAGRKRKKS